MAKEYKWCAIDAEGDVGDKGLLGVAFYSDITQAYITDHELIKEELLEHALQGYTFLAHNAQYDLSVIFWQLNIPIKAIYFNGRFNRGEWKYVHNKPKAQLWDTLALSGGLSLDDLGKSLHLRKYPTPSKLVGTDANRYTWKCDTHSRWECESCYAIRDSEIVYRFMVTLTEQLRAWDIEPKRRISNLAVHVWRKLDNPAPIAIDNYRARMLARAAYHGGRVETFKLGHIAGIHSADVCSMYPSILATTPFPDPETLIFLKDPALHYFDSSLEGVIDCDITVPVSYCPPLPFLDHGVIKYPVGRFRGQWTLAEIRYAISLGAKLNRIYAMAFTKDVLYPFSRFVGTLWEMRQAYEQQGDPRSLFAKLLMNNLYGRLGVSDTMEMKEIYPADTNVSLKKQPHNEWYTEDRILYLTFVKDRKFGKGWSNVMWAAQTTAYARMKLHQFLLQQGENIIYCDTDSVFSTQPIIGLGEGLGSLRDPIDYDRMIVGAPKMYALKRYAHQMPEQWEYERCKDHHKVSCDECLWYAKAKGVRKSMAMKFLKEGTVTYTQPIKPASQGIRKIEAGTWVQVTKKDHHVPHRRQPIEPSALIDYEGWSDTVAPVCGVRIG